MEVRTKLKLCVLLSAIALIFKIIATASPGWTVIKTDVFFNPADDLMPQDDGLHADDLTEMMKPQKQKVSISFGLWYYRVCKCSKGDDDDDDDSSSQEHDDDDMKDDVQKPMIDESDEDKRHRRHKHHGKHHHHDRKCYVRSYRKGRHHNKEKIDKENLILEAEKEYEEVPREFKPAADFIVQSVEVARHARHEIASYASVGVFLSVVGMIGAIVYARGGGMGKHSGRLACSTQVLSSFLFWMAIIRVASYIIQLKKAREMMTDSLGRSMLYDFEFECPWCLWVAAVGASIMGLTSLFHLIMVSRDKECKRSEYFFHTENKVPIIAPKGYEQLIVPPSYEEAGPLPDKKPIV